MPGLNELQHHVAISHSEWPLACFLCGNTYFYHNLLQQHVIRHTQNPLNRQDKSSSPKNLLVMRDQSLWYAKNAEKVSVMNRVEKGMSMSDMWLMSETTAEIVKWNLEIMRDLGHIKTRHILLNKTGITINRDARLIMMVEEVFTLTSITIDLWDNLEGLESL